MAEFICAHAHKCIDDNGKTICDHAEAHEEGYECEYPCEMPRGVHGATCKAIEL